jgi:predicted DNA-binding transcriptional regulator AlpA
MTKYLDIDELATFLGQSTQTIKKKLRSVPAQLPPKMHIPGSKMLRWRMHEVENWLTDTGRSKVMGEKSSSMG